MSVNSAAASSFITHCQQRDQVRDQLAERPAEMWMSVLARGEKATLNGELTSSTRTPAKGRASSCDIAVVRDGSAQIELNRTETESANCELPA